MRIFTAGLCNSLFIFFLLITNIGFAQIIDPNDRLLSKEQAVEEYTLLYESLINYHPEPFMYIDSTSLEKHVAEKINHFTEEISFRDFHLEVRELIAKIKCGHTYAKPSVEWYEEIEKNLWLLPFAVNIEANRAYVKSTTKGEFDFKIKDEIISINEVSIDDILNRMRAIQERDGDINGFVESKIERVFRFYYLFLYGMPDEVKVKFISDGQTQETIVKLTGSGLYAVKEFGLTATLEVQLENKWSTFAINKDTKTAYLKIKSVSDRKEYKTYYASVFKTMQDENIERLILDLRNNGGGFFGHGNTLLTYLCRDAFEFNFRRSKKKTENNKHVKRDFFNRLTKFAFSVKPKKNKLKDYKQHNFSYKPNEYYFGGKLDVLINGGTFSQASLVSAKLNEEGATFFGAETGGTESGTNAMVNSKLTLPYSGIQVNIPYYRVVTYAQQAKNGRGILPDVDLPAIKFDAITDTQLEHLLKN